MQRHPFQSLGLGGVQYVDTLRKDRHSTNKGNIRFAKLIGVFAGERYGGFALRLDPSLLQYFALHKNKRLAIDQDLAAQDQKHTRVLHADD
ncbi:hypothetical protein [Pseudomonas sp. MF6747]|uniref:hypothetical protein n=1 Tax=Pseudomonas sp. MF6747 TaxID=2797527 RepID=UPI0030DD21B8